VNGENNYTEFWGKDYHTVKDEFDPEWKLEGMRQTIKYSLHLIDRMNKDKVLVEMKKDIPFPTEMK
jgi:hypothetical protein